MGSISIFLWARVKGFKINPPQRKDGGLTGKK
jgi:hypothetical protein